MSREFDAPPHEAARPDTEAMRLLQPRQASACSVVVQAFRPAGSLSRLLVGIDVPCPDERPRAAPRERRVEKRILRPPLSMAASIELAPPLV